MIYAHTHPIPPCFRLSCEIEQIKKESMIIIKRSAQEVKKKRIEIIFLVFFVNIMYSLFILAAIQPNGS